MQKKFIILLPFILMFTLVCCSGDKCSYFEELSVLAMPENCVENIELLSVEDGTACKLYNYILPEEETEARDTYQKYIKIVSDDISESQDMELEYYSETTVTIIYEDEGVAQILSRYFPDRGNIMQIVFPYDQKYVVRK